MFGWVSLRQGVQLLQPGIELARQGPLGSAAEERGAITVLQAPVRQPVLCCRRGTAANAHA